MKGCCHEQILILEHVLKSTHEGNLCIMGILQEEHHKLLPLLDAGVSPQADQLFLHEPEVREENAHEGSLFRQTAGCPGSRQQAS